MLNIKAEISREALHQRFNQGSADFLKSCLERVIYFTVSASRHVEFPTLEAFNRVCIWDSSSWQVSEELKESYRGCGGSGSAAGCKLQYCYDVKSSSIVHCELTSGTVPDQRYGNENITAEVQRGDLFFFDLGFVTLLTLGGIAQKGAYFLARLDPMMTVSVDNKPLNLYSFLRKNKSLKHKELDVLVGSKQVGARLVIVKVPPEEVERRKRKLKKQAKRKKRNPSPQRLFLTAWNFFITNAPEDKLPKEKIYPLYRLRWSVEILFKQFKSHLQIHAWNHANIYRLQCEIYSTLIVSALISYAHGLLQHTLWKEKSAECSMEKTFKFFANKSHELFDIAYGNIDKPAALISSIIKDALRVCIRVLQKSRISSLQRIYEY